MKGSLGTFWLVAVVGILLVTGQLLYALCGILIALIIGYAWPWWWNGRLDEEYYQLRGQLVSGIAQLENAISPPKKGGAKAPSVEDAEFLRNVFGTIPDKHRMRLKLEALTKDLASLEKMLLEEHHVNVVAGVCLGAAFLMLPSTVCWLIIIYLVGRWFLMPIQA